MSFMISDFMAARLQMAISLGFHIIFACIGMAMPFLMSIAHYKWLKSKNPAYLKLTQAWSRGVAIFFAVGAVSGTVLSFELGLLWPKFMEHAGPIIGMPFSWEGTAFFLEAIALGIFLYGWDRIHPWIHWASGLFVGIMGVLSGLFVICANGWMNSPTGFDWINQKAIHIDPWAAMFNPAALNEGIHMIVASFVATSFSVAGLHAIGILKNKNHSFHRHGLKISLVIGSIFALIQPLHGDILAKEVAIRQPIKFAAMESLFRTSQPAPLLIGGIPDMDTETIRYGIHIPKLLSFLAHGDFNSQVQGLDSAPKKDWPPVPVVHIAFQIMVGIGSLLASIGLLSLVFIWKKSQFLYHPLFLKIISFILPLGFIAIEAGWTVTEVGRQPWIIYKIMRTVDAVTPVPGVVYSLILFTSIYVFLSLIIVWLMMRQFRYVNESK